MSWQCGNMKSIFFSIPNTSIFTFVTKFSTITFLFTFYTSNMKNRYVRRVDQLDAIALDSELFVLLNAHYRRAFTYIKNSTVAKIDPELDIIFRFLFRYLPLSFLGASFGQNMFELKYCNSKSLSPASISKLRLLAALNIVLPWFWDRVLRRTVINSGRNDSRRMDIEVLLKGQKLITLWKLLSLFNFCAFLQQSKFPSVTERVLQIRPIYTATQDIKIMQYDGISKELLWHGLDELLGFTLPLINVYRLKNYVNRIWYSWKNKGFFPKYIEAKVDCAICGNIPNYPHTIGCAHLFCYYCIASMLLADPNFSCIECNFVAKGIESIKPLPINRPSIDLCN